MQKYSLIFYRIYQVLDMMAYSFKVRCNLVLKPSKKKKDFQRPSPAAERMPHSLAMTLGNPLSPARGLYRVDLLYPQPLGITPSQEGVTKSQVTISHTQPCCLVAEFSASVALSTIKTLGPCLSKDTGDLTHPSSSSILILGFWDSPEILKQYASICLLAA